MYDYTKKMWKSPSAKSQMDFFSALEIKPFDGRGVQNKNASIVSKLTSLYGGEGGI
jgi:hypothetical protein